ncbi:hypothetical protein [Acaryochloris sp. CCMEE 5410]|uniref:hypothetical protein n=1 Tax=Acaryochloris sp. CCMEE 5410 TaxID=310037 RepID=UPI0021CFC6BB|nr:hypothetical protein [Acaryochloris sp. CCMEE 5410]
MTKSNVFLTLVLSIAAGLITSAFGFWSVTEKESASTSAAPKGPTPSTLSAPTPENLPDVQSDIVLADPEVVPRPPLLPLNQPPVIQRPLRPSLLFLSVL